MINVEDEVQGIPVLDFGNKIVIAGVLFTDTEDNSYIALLPKKDKPKNVEIIQPSYDEWYTIFEQQDYNFVKGEFNGEHILLRKSQRNVDGKISWQVFKRDNYACRYCGIDHVPLTVDHIITWETGGATHPDNLLTSCKKCNRTRGNTPYEEFLKSDYYQNKEQYLSESIKHANAMIINILHKLPRVKKIRKR